VSLGPKRGELIAKLAGASGEPPLPVANLTGAGVEPGLAPRSGAFASRLVAALAIFLLGWLGLRTWRGGLLVTRRCLKCGEPFSRRTRAGAEAAELCNPCYHLYVVKDGISVPARRAKLAEVDSWERRGRIALRLLSLVSPGAGHAYAGRAVAGVLLGVAWYAALASAALLQTGTLSFADATWELGGSLPLYGSATIAILIWVVGNFTTPSLEQPLPSARRARRAAA
jgi:hypothetical protein